jgi:2-hydroxy-3-oxopropionate reductase
MKVKAGFVGLGAMGAPIARNLLAAGFAIRVHNRTIARAAPLVAEGAELASSPADTWHPTALS